MWSKNLFLWVSLFVIIFSQQKITAQNFKTVKIGKQTWMADNLDIEVLGSWCYEYKAENGKKYGRLYTWDAAMKACPKGWHLPSDAEWTTLTDYFGGEDVAGKVLKIGGSSGFNIKLGGLCDNHNFRLINSYGTYWTSTKYNQNQVWYRYFTETNASITRTYFRIDYGFCVRCLKD